MANRKLSAGLIAVLWAGLAPAAGAVEPLPQGSVSIPDGLNAFSNLYKVLSHPRCANCHVGADNRPMWWGPHYGKTRPHGMFINAGESRIGAETQPCATCHTDRNSDKPNGPPGAENWSLPPVEMVWFGRSIDQICEQLRDPDRNGGRTILEVADHIDHDKLVHWGWEPGSDRQPAPYSIAETVQLVLLWEASGAPCPAPEDQTGE